MNTTVMVSAEYKKLEQTYRRLQKYFDGLNELKSIVNAQLADTKQDPSGHKQRESIADIFPGGLSALDNEAGCDLEIITVLFKKLETQLHQLEIEMRNAR